MLRFLSLFLTESLYATQKHDLAQVLKLHFHGNEPTVRGIRNYSVSNVCARDEISKEFTVFRIGLCKFFSRKIAFYKVQSLSSEEYLLVPELIGAI